MNNDTQIGKTKKASRHPDAKLKFGEFFNAKKTQVSPPKEGVQGITIDKDPGKARKNGFPKGTKPGDGGLAESLLQHLLELSFTPQPADPRGQAERPVDNGLGKPAQEPSGDEIDGGEMDITPRDNDAEMGLDSLNGDNQEPEDPNKAGVIRKVKGAHLVYKREMEEGKYEELWVYPLGSATDEAKLRQTVLAGTDIAPGEQSSEDGSQSYDVWTAGNAQMMHIEGLPQ